MRSPEQAKWLQVAAMSLLLSAMGCPQSPATDSGDERDAQPPACTFPTIPYRPKPAYTGRRPKLPTAPTVATAPKVTLPSPSKSSRAERVMDEAGCARLKESTVLANQGDAIVAMDPNGAIGKYQQALELAPERPQILYKLAIAYKKKERWDKVASTLQRATKIAPDYANYWFLRGYALEQQARKTKKSKTDLWHQAAVCLQNCVAADPNFDGCYAHLGRVYQRLDEKQLALVALTKAVEVRPNEINHYAPLMKHYLRLDLPTEAAAVGLVAKQLTKPSDKAMTKVHLALAQIADKQGNPITQISELEAAKALGGVMLHPEILFELGIAYARVARKTEALQMLKGFRSRVCRAKRSGAHQARCATAQTELEKLR